jgi:hypothetical protein
LYHNILFIYMIVYFRTLQSYNRMFYTWENPAGLRLIMWETANKKDISDTLRKVL